jgi:hypothetical protein
MRRRLAWLVLLALPPAAACGSFGGGADDTHVADDAGDETAAPPDATPPPPPPPPEVPFCNAHPNAWICDDFGNPDAGLADWMQCLVGPGARLEVSTADFRSPPSSLHAVISAEGAADASDPNHCGQSAIIHRDRSKDTTKHIELDAKIVKGVAAQNVDVAFAGAAFVDLDGAVISAPAITYSAAKGSLAFVDLSNPDAGGRVLNGPGSDWIHVIFDFDSATEAFVVVQRSGSADQVTSKLPIQMLPIISAEFGLRAEAPADYEIYIDNVLAE